LLDRIPDGGAIVNTASTAGGQWATHVEPITTLLDLDDWDAALEWIDATSPRSGAAVLLLQGARADVHVALLASDDPARRAHQLRVPVADRHALAQGLPGDDDRQAHRLNIGETNGRAVTAREVATVLAFLGSDAAVYVNGVNLLVDAGFTAAMTTGQVDFSALREGHLHTGLTVCEIRVMMLG